MHTADAVVDDPNAVITVVVPAEVTDRLGTEAVITEKDVADTGHQGARGHGHYMCRIRMYR